MDYIKGIGKKLGWRHDLTGLRFDKLLVTKFIGSKKGSSLFECKCDCGKTIERLAPQLKTKTLMGKSCGCVSPLPHLSCEGMIGKRFGKLVVVSRAENYVTAKKTISQWKCQCDCGKETIVMGNSLRKKLTKSCGCLFTEFVHGLEPGLAAKRYLFRVSKALSKRRGIIWSLSFEDYVGICEKKCSYCGCEPNQLQEGLKNRGQLLKHYGSWLHHGIDRVNNEVGYTIINSVSSCKICNTAKMTMSVEEFKNHAGRIHSYIRGETTQPYSGPSIYMKNGHAGEKIFDNLSGQKIANITINRRICSINGHSFYECKCDCGKIIEIFGFQLKHRGVSSCGCNGGVLKIPKFTIGKIQRSYFGLAKSQNKRRNMPFRLTFKDFIRISEQRCYYCGKYPDKRIQIDKDGNGWDHGGIDRKDNSIGYVLSNVVPCCEHCNIMKASLSADEFISHVGKIVAHNSLTDV